MTHHRRELRILLVEDNDDHRTLVRHALDRLRDWYELRVTEAGTLAAAREVLLSQPIDVGLIDLGLPDSDVSDTLGEILRLDSDAAIIALTSLDDVDFGTQAVQDGAQDFLVKSEIDNLRLIRSIVYAVQRREKERALATANQELRRFAHTVAHEVRTPAAAAIMAIDYFREIRQEDPETAEEMLNTTSASLRGLMELVSDLLLFAENSEVEANDRVDLNELLDQVVTFVQPELAELGGSIDVTSLPVVRGNQTLLVTVFQNLVNNAIKYRSDEPPVIRITSEEVGECGRPGYRVSVVDNGRGIPAEHRDSVFGMFFRTEPQGLVEGTGVGLALCKNVMIRLGGEIEVADRPTDWDAPGTTGSEFRLTFPYPPNNRPATLPAGVVGSQECVAEVAG